MLLSLVFSAQSLYPKNHHYFWLFNLIWYVPFMQQYIWAISVKLLIFWHFIWLSIFFLCTAAFWSRWRSLQDCVVSLKFLPWYISVVLNIVELISQIEKYINRPSNVLMIDFFERLKEWPIHRKRNEERTMFLYSKCSGCQNFISADPKLVHFCLCRWMFQRIWYWLKKRF